MSSVGSFCCWVGEGLLGQVRAGASDETVVMLVVVVAAVSTRGMPCWVMPAFVEGSLVISGPSVVRPLAIWLSEARFDGCWFVSGAEGESQAGGVLCMDIVDVDAIGNVKMMMW